MSIRVVGGQYGGRKLDTPPGMRTHPMGERIRNALFNSIGNEIDSKTVLDAFAGTGAIGIEALSRGAAHATFVEKDKIAQNCISNNIKALGIENAKLIKAFVNTWLNSYTGEGFDIIFADPPYYDTQIASINKLIGVLNPDGILVLSWPEQQPLPELTDDVELEFNRVYAGARILMFRSRRQFSK